MAENTLKNKGGPIGASQKFDALPNKAFTVQTPESFLLCDQSHMAGVTQEELDEMFAMALPQSTGASRREFLCDNGIDFVSRDDIQQLIKDMLMRKVISSPRLSKMYNSNTNHDHDCSKHLFRRDVHRGWGGTMATNRHVVDQPSVCELLQIKIAVYSVGSARSTEKCWCGGGKPTRECHNEHLCVQFTDMRGEWHPFCCDVPDCVHNAKNLLWSYDSIYGCPRKPTNIHMCGSKCKLTPIVLQHRQEECVCPLTLQSLFANIDDGEMPLPAAAMGNSNGFVTQKQTAAQKRANAFNLGASCTYPLPVLLHIYRNGNTDGRAQCETANSKSVRD